MLIAEAASALPMANLFATLPFWPLLGAIAVGVMIAMKPRPDAGDGGAGHGGHDHGHAGHGHGDHGHGAHGHADASILGYAHWPVIIGVGISALLAIVLFFTLTPPAETSHEGHAAVSTAEATHGLAPEVNYIGISHTVYHWISLGSEASAAGNWINLNFLFDGLTGIMLVVVCVVGLMVVIYASGYMRDHHGHPERGYERFFAFLGLFVFSMCMLVLAGNFVLLYLGWELVGLCSYLLIGFYYHKPEAAAAAKKAFLVNRIGDFGFALGIFALYMYILPHVQPGESALDYTTVFRHASHLATTDSGFWGWSQSTVVSLLLLCGALGKSAQFPLYVWLPDAMEGPTPVSALIHAATMVTAGVYMVARCGPLFAASPLALDVIIVIGLIGAFLAASMAMAQWDMKRIMAYSTMSQLAYMFVGLGCLAPSSAIFHLYTHAFFKALLFLCAGGVMHAMGNVIDLRRFSGLRTVMPITYKLTLIGCLALAGFPLLAGFWSKDEIVHAAFERGTWIGVILLIVAAMTAYYTFRMFFLCFHGPKRLPPEAGDHPHESPAIMLRPLYVLAFGAVFAGYVGVHAHASMSDSFLGAIGPHGYFHHYVEHSSMVTHPGEHGGGAWLMYLSMLIALGGIGLAYVRYGTAPTADPDQALLGGLWNLWNAKYYVDEIYDFIFVRPLRALANLCFGIDRGGVDGLVNVTGHVPVGLSYVFAMFQRGALQGYALSMVIGLALLLFVLGWGAAN